MNVDIAAFGPLLLFGALLSALAPLAIIVGGIWLVRHWSATRRDPAEDELRARFARGEIDEQEYAARLRILRDRSS